MENSIDSLRYSLLGLMTAATWAALLAAGAAPEMVSAEVNTQVSLKLDYDLVPKIGMSGVDGKALARSDRAPELQSRVLKVQDQVDALVRANQEKMRLLKERERMVSSIRGVVSAQDQMINVLKTEISRPAPVAVVPPPPPPPVATPEPPPAPVAVPAPAAAMPAAPAPLQIGPVEIPASIRPWLVEGGLGIVIVVLLGLTLHSRAAARAKEAELAALTSGVALAPAAAEAAPPTEMPATIEPAAPRVPQYEEPEPAALQPITPAPAAPVTEEKPAEASLAAVPETGAAPAETEPEGPTIFNIDTMADEAIEPGEGTEPDDGPRPDDAPEAAAQADQMSETATQDSEFDPDDVDFLFEVFGEEEESLEKNKDKSADKT